MFQSFANANARMVCMVHTMSILLIHYIYQRGMYELNMSPSRRHHTTLPMSNIHPFVFVSHFPPISLGQARVIWFYRRLHLAITCPYVSQPTKSLGNECTSMSSTSSRLLLLAIPFTSLRWLSCDLRLKVNVNDAVLREKRWFVPTCLHTIHLFVAYLDHQLQVLIENHPRRYR